MESEQDDEAHSERRQGETLVHTETVRQRGISNTRSSSRPGTNRGKATSMPVHNPQSWRNPGGPIRTPAGNKAASYAAAKPNNAGKYKGANGHAGRNVRRQHPYNNKHRQKESADGCHTPRKELVPRSSLQRTNVKCADPAKQEFPGNDVHRRSDKPKKTLAATFCGYPSEDEEDLV